MSFKVEDHYDLRKHLHVDHNMILYEERKSSCVECHSESKTSTTWENTSTLTETWFLYEERKNSCIECHSELTLLGQGGGGLYAPLRPCFCTYLCKYSRSALKKIDFFQLYVWKRAVCFLPRKIISFCRKKNDVRQKHPNFLGGDPYELGRRPLQPMKIYKSQLLSRGVLVIQTSWICLNMASYFQIDLQL